MPTTRPKVLLTGATGFLGKSLVPLLTDTYDVHILSRSGPQGAKPVQDHGLRRIQADLTKWRCGLDEDQFSDLSSLDFVGLIHLAALYDLNADEDTIFLNNTVGTSHALALAQNLRIPTFINASSVATCINTSKAAGQVDPYDLNFKAKFPDPYARSKAICELKIKNWNEEAIPTRINLRLGVLVGDTQNGTIERVDGPYLAPVFFKKAAPFLTRLPKTIILPGSPQSKLPLVPVDQAAQVIARVLSKALHKIEPGYKSFHVVPNEGLSVEDLYLETLHHLSVPKKNIRLTRGVPRTWLEPGANLIGFPSEQLAYIMDMPRFSSQELWDHLDCDTLISEFSDYKDSFWRGYENYISNR